MRRVVRRAGPGLWLALALALAAGLPAQPVAAPATVPTSEELQALESGLAEQQKALQAELGSARATPAVTAAEGSGPERDDSVRLLQALDQLELVGQQELRAVRSLGALAAARAGLEKQAAELAKAGPPGTPPWSVLALDKLGDELEAEQARAANIASEASASAFLLEAAEAQRAEKDKVLRDGKAEQESARDPLLRRLLARRRAADEAEARLAGEVVRQRQLEVREAALAADNQRVRVQLLRDQAGLVQAQVFFAAEELDGVMARLDAQAKEAAKAQDATRTSLANAEARVVRLRQKRDLLRSPDPTLGDSLATAELEVQCSQRALGMVATQQIRIEVLREAWKRRYALASRSAEASDLLAWERQIADRREELGRQETVQAARIAETRADLSALQAALGALDPPDPKRSKPLKDRIELSEKLVRQLEDELAGLSGAQQLLRRLARELDQQIQGGLFSRGFARARVAAVEYWEAHVEHLVWPAVHILALLLLGIPFLWFLTVRSRATVARIYGGQSGMIVGKGVFWLGLTAIAIALLNELGVGLGPMLGAAGITGVALGFAAQTSVSNMISGLFLIAESPFGVDDVITVEGITGTVLSVDLLSIKLRTFDNRFVRIPNETILKTNVTNLSRYPIRRVDLMLRIAYREDMTRVRSILLELARSNPLGLIHPAPQVFFQGFGDSGIELQFSVWCARADLVDLKAALMIAVQQAFLAAGIAIPLPQLAISASESAPPVAVRVEGPAVKAGAP